MSVRRLDYCRLHDTPISGEWYRWDVEKFIPILGHVESLVRNGSLYDICSFQGQLPWLARLRGWGQVGGNDVNMAAVVAAEKHFGIKLDYGHFEDLELKGPYSVIISHHGIEHVGSPRAMLEKALRLLEPEGIVYLVHPAVPDQQIEQWGEAGHVHEWTFDAFGNLVEMLPCKIVAADHASRSQRWILKKE